MARRKKPFSETVWLLGGGGALIVALGIGPTLFLGHPDASFASSDDVGLVEGRITDVATGRPPRRSRRRGGSQRQNRSWCSVEITYSVGGRDYDIIDYRHSLSRGDAERCAEQNSLGRVRSVYYLRSKPTVGFLDAERFGNWWYLTASLLILTPVGAWLLTLAWRIHNAPPV